MGLPCITATFAAQGADFMAIAMDFRNIVRHSKHQAVALRVQGDRAIFLNCHMEGVPRYPLRPSQAPVLPPLHFHRHHRLHLRRCCRRLPKISSQPMADWTATRPLGLIFQNVISSLTRSLNQWWRRSPATSVGHGRIARGRL